MDPAMLNRSDITAITCYGLLFAAVVLWAALRSANPNAPTNFGTSRDTARAPIAATPDLAVEEHLAVGRRQARWIGLRRRQAREPRRQAISGIADHRELLAVRGLRGRAEPGDRRRQSGGAQQGDVERRRGGDQHRRAF